MTLYDLIKSIVEEVGGELLSVTFNQADEHHCAISMGEVRREGRVINLPPITMLGNPEYELDREEIRKNKNLLSNHLEQAIRR